VESKDFSVGVLKLLELAHKVPEVGASNDLVRGEDAHSENLGVGLGLADLLTAYNDVFTELNASNMIRIMLFNAKRTKQARTGFLLSLISGVDLNKTKEGD